METLLACHDRGVFHNDVKDENLLLDLETMRLKLIDFGAALPFSQRRVYTSNDFNGTRIWAAPEFLEHAKLRAESATVWSLGCLLYDMLCGDIPFRREQDAIQGKFQYRRQGLSASVVDLIDKCLKVKPRDRIRLQDILKHPWVSGQDSDGEQLTDHSETYICTESSNE